MCKRKVSVRRYRAHGGNWADSRSYAMVQIMKVWTDEVLMKLALVKTGNDWIEKNTCRYRNRVNYEDRNPG